MHINECINTNITKYTEYNYTQTLQTDICYFFYKNGTIIMSNNANIVFSVSWSFG